MCERRQPTAKQAVAAIVVGHEVMFLAGDYLLPYGGRGHPVDHGSGSMGSIAAAASVCNLLRLEAVAAAESLRIAQSYMPGGINDCAVRRGSMTKENIPWGAVTGYRACRMALAGGTGQASIFEDPAYVSGFIARLGEYRGVLDSCTKEYAACRHVHWAIDALAQIADRGAISPREIEEYPCLHLQRCCSSELPRARRY